MKTIKNIRSIWKDESRFYIIDDVLGYVLDIMPSADKYWTQLQQNLQKDSVDISKHIVDFDNTMAVDLIGTILILSTIPADSIKASFLRKDIADLIIFDMKNKKDTKPKEKTYNSELNKALSKIVKKKKS